MRFHVGGGLDIFELGQQLTFTNAVAFLHQDFGDLTHGVRTDIDVILGFNFAGGGYLADEIRAHHLSGLDSNHAPLAVDGAGVHTDRRNQ